MSGAQNAAHTTASPSSSPSTITTQNMQGYAQVGTTLCDTDDDLSDAPESPVFPTFSTTRGRSSTTPPSDSDSDLSDVPTNSPVWPESPKASPSPPDCTTRHSPESSEASPTPPRCTERDCPIRNAVRRHNQGPYLHGGKPPRTNETIFSNTNPPPLVWESLMKIQARDPSSTVEDDWNVLGFLRYHVDNPDTSFMGICEAGAVFGKLEDGSYLLRSHRHQSG